MNILSVIQGFPQIGLIDIIDILLVAYLFYEIYKLVKGTNVMGIFIGIMIIYAIWKIVSILQMKLLSDLLGQFISMGMLALVVVFQPEIRRFLLQLGTKSFIGIKKRFLFWKINVAKKKKVNYEPYVQACKNMSNTQTGALIVFMQENELNDIIASGEGVTGVDAVPHPALILHTLNDIGKVLEAVANICALPCGVLNNSRHTLGTFQRIVDAVGHALQTLLLRATLQVATRVEVEHRQAQLLAAVHLIIEGCARLLQPLFGRMPQVDEVTVVRQDIAGIVAILLAALFEKCNTLLGQRL